MTKATAVAAPKDRFIRFIAALQSLFTVIAGQVLAVDIAQHRPTEIGDGIGVILIALGAAAFWAIDDYKISVEEAAQ